MATSRPAGFDYQTYLASREWAILKRQVKARSGGLCERCHFGKHQDTHHLTYERIGHERLEDLQGVCRDCHEYLSGVSDRDPAAEFRLYPAVQFVRYEHRAEREWYAYIQIVGRVDAFELRVGDDADGLFAVFCAMAVPEKVWHPIRLSGELLDAFLCPGHDDDEDRPPFIRQLATCFFPCEGEGCDECKVPVS